MSLISRLTPPPVRNTFNFRHSSHTQNAVPVLNFTATVIIPGSGKKTYTDTAFSNDFPIVISSTDNNLIHNSGSCIHITAPLNNLESNHTRIMIDEFGRLMLEHGAQEACTKIFYKDFISGKYTNEGSVTLNSDNPTTLITSPEFYINSGLVQIEVELLPEIKKYVNDTFAIFSIKECNSDKESDNSKILNTDEPSEKDIILDPVDSKVIIGNDNPSAKVVVRNGFRFGRYEDTEVSFSEDNVSRACFYVILEGENPHIHSYEPMLFTAILPDGSEEEFDEDDNYPLAAGLKFKDRFDSYEFTVLDFCNGYDFNGEKAKAEIAADEQPEPEFTAEAEDYKIDDDDDDDDDLFA